MTKEINGEKLLNYITRGQDLGEILTIIKSSKEKSLLYDQLQDRLSFIITDALYSLRYIKKEEYALLFQRLGYQHIARLVDDQYYLIKFLPYIEEIDRFNFLQKIGIDKVRGFLKDDKDLNKLLKNFPNKMHAKIKKHFILFEMSELKNKKLSPDYKFQQDENILEIIKNIEYVNNDNERSTCMLALPNKSIIILNLEHNNIVNNYKDWFLDIFDLENQTIERKLHIPKQQHSYVTRLSLLQDGETIIAWDNSFRSSMDRHICFIDITNFSVQTLSLNIPHKGTIQKLCALDDGTVGIIFKTDNGSNLHYNFSYKKIKNYNCTFYGALYEPAKSPECTANISTQRFKYN